MINFYLETKKTKEKMHELSRQVEIESHKREIVADTLHGQEGLYIITTPLELRVPKRTIYYSI